MRPRKALKAAIYYAGLNQNEVAAAVGVTAKKLSHIICGRRHPDDELEGALSVVLGVSREKLFPSVEKSPLKDRGQCPSLETSAQESAH